MNGKPAADEASELVYHVNNCYYKVYLGADVNGGGTDEAHSKCSIAQFSMSPEVMTADEVREGAIALGCYTPDNNGGLVQTIIGDITNAISVFMQNMGRTLVDFFDNVVVNEGKLTTFATWTLVFVGVGFGSKFVGKLMRKAD